MQQKTALVIGASGLIGKECLYYLFNDDHYSKVIVLVRKLLTIKDKKLEQLVIDFDNLKNYTAEIKADHIFCCLGTTMRTAGSKENFRKVDFEYPVIVAQLAKNNGAEKFLLISSVGANKTSNNFYLKTKGETEAAIANLNYPSLIILRPSMLLGNRHEFRLGELIGKKFMQVFSFLFLGPLKKYKAIYGWKVAKAMVKAAVEENKGMLVLESQQIEKKATG